MDETNRLGVQLRVLAEDNACFNDYIWGEKTGPVSDPDVDDTYFAHEHNCVD